MSAAASALPDPISRARAGWLRIPRAFYEIAAGELTKSEHVILGLGFALVQLVRRSSAVIPIDRFARGARISISAAYQCTKELDRSDYMNYKIENGQREYKPKMQEVRAGIIVEGQCGTCGEFTSGDIITGFVPTPYSLMMKLGAACSTQAAWLCALKIWHETGDLDPAGDHVVTKAKLDWMIVDFEAATGLSRRSVQEGLAELAALKILKSEPHPNDARRLLYWLDLVALDKIKPRPWQTCDQPERKPSAKAPIIESAGETEITEGEASVSAPVGAREYQQREGEEKAVPQPPPANVSSENTQPISAVKFTGRLVWARCFNCSTVVPFRETVHEAPPPEPEIPPDEVPKPKSEPEPAKGKTEIASTDQKRRDIGFERFYALFMAAGKPLNDRDMDRARALWNNYSLAECIAIFHWAINQFKTGAWRTAQLTPTPANALLSEGWTRVAMERVLPMPQRPMSDFERRREEAMDRVRKEFAKVHHG